MINCIVSNKILYICKKEYQYFFRKANVVGVGLGNKVKNGVETNRECIKVFVSQKVPMGCLNKEDLIPTSYKGIITDVLENGIFKATSLKKRVRPVFGGYSVGPACQIRAEQQLGTLACLVRDNTKIYMLSANHNLASENRLQIGNPITQPSTLDGGKLPKDVVGELSKFIPIQFTSGTTRYDNYVDCAIAEVKDRSLVSSMIALVGNPKKAVEPKVNMDVIKVGRTTELTVGKIISIGSSVIVEYTIGEALFVNQIITTKMAKPGDSGSLLMDYKNNSLGLLVSNSKTFSCWNDIRKVLDELNVRLVTE